MTVAEIVTEKIIKKLESGTIPWCKPWEGGDAINYVTRKPYRGINRILLDGGEYLTFKQIAKLGGSIKCGAKAYIVVFYKSSPLVDEEGNAVLDDNGEQKMARLLRYYHVFSLGDVEGIESKIKVTERNNCEIGDCQDVLDGYIENSGVTLRNDNISGRAYYSPSEDLIVLPMMKQFASSEHYYATAFHEATHSTGHRTRLNRLTERAAKGGKEYSKEELVAEIGSAMLCRYCKIGSAELIDNSAAYIESWLTVLKNDTNMIMYAAAKAEKAYEMILG